MWQYQQYVLPGNMNNVTQINKSLSPKIGELKSAFEENEQAMEWERIVEETVLQFTAEYGISDLKVEDYMSSVTSDISDCLKVEVQENIIENWKPMI